MKIWRALRVGMLNWLFQSRRIIDNTGLFEFIFYNWNIEQFSLTQSYVNSRYFKFRHWAYRQILKLKSETEIDWLFCHTCCFASQPPRPKSDHPNSYDGQSGNRFFQKSLYGFILWGYYWSLWFCSWFQFEPVFVPTFSVEYFLKNMKIPYLWVSNVKLPEIFENMMKESSAENRSFIWQELIELLINRKLTLSFRFYCNVVDDDEIHLTVAWQWHTTWNAKLVGQSFIRRFDWNNYPRSRCELTLRTSQGPPTDDSRATLNIIILLKLGGVFDYTKENLDILY